MKADRLFHLKENHTDVKTEVIAGITTFMTMAYILAVNPTILSAAGMDSGAIFTAMYGTVFELSICTGTWNGVKCLLCVYRSRLNGIFVADSTGGSICGRYYLYPAVFNKSTGSGL